MELFTVEEVAQRLKLSARSVRRYIQAGRLRAVRPGRGYRVSDDALAAFLAAATVSPNREAERPATVRSAVPVQGLSHGSSHGSKRKKKRHRR